VCISFPTFDPATYEKMMGVRGVPDLAQIVDRARIPVKISCVIDEHNTAELPQFLERCHTIGIKRLVLRRLYGDTRTWDIIKPSSTPLCSAQNALRPHGEYRGNPVYDYRDLEVTVWNFDQCDCTSLNLFSDGTISADYRLANVQSTM